LIRKGVEAVGVRAHAVHAEKPEANQAREPDVWRLLEPATLEM
jgi:hypothetical protein